MTKKVTVPCINKNEKACIETSDESPSDGRRQGDKAQTNWLKFYLHYVSAIFRCPSNVIISAFRAISDGLIDSRCRNMPHMAQLLYIQLPEALEQSRAVVHDFQEIPQFLSHFDHM